MPGREQGKATMKGHIALIVADGVAGFLPGGKTTADCLDVGITEFHEDSCRTGARFFTRSGTVGDDFRRLRQFLVPALQIIQRNGKGTGNMRLGVVPRAAHIDDNGRATVQSFFGLRH